jgi:hypothetical protein
MPGIIHDQKLEQYVRDADIMILDEVGTGGGRIT